MIQDILRGVRQHAQSMFHDQQSDMKLSSSQRCICLRPSRVRYVSGSTAEGHVSNIFHLPAAI